MSYGGSAMIELWTVGGPVTHCLLTGSPCLSVWMHTWRDCWRRKIVTKSCYATWKHTIGQDCMFARLKWKFSKGSCQRPRRRRKGQTHSVSWLKHPSLTMVLISLHPVAKSKKFEIFGAFWKFFGNLQVFARGVVSPPARPLVRIARNWKKLTFLERLCKY